MSKEQTTTKTQKAVVATDIQIAQPQSKKSDEIKYQVRAELRQKGGTYFYSSAIAGRKNIFVTPEYMDLLVNAIRLAELKKDVKNLAYVVMPNHFYWIFRLSEKQDDPLPIYKDVKKEVAWEILKNLRQEAQEDQNHYKLLDLFQKNEKVQRSNPRRILWSLKQEAKKLNPDGQQRYKVWEPKAKLFLIKNDQSLLRNLQYIQDAPVSERWQLVDKAKDYPYLYVAEEMQEVLKA